ncbi:hypothetical protein KIN20_030227 [Parelaphostrongylus tenuis]|uniref:Uncharacterized protein n=1 Tax=Parelaphostrongylus tenuis TaxID=148309 RepID=A0AAD5R3S7_PARTN|nr:hypothetical protein KIN20_030227 [Parelaphostrongylus tenuis]
MLNTKAKILFQRGLLVSTSPASLYLFPWFTLGIPLFLLVSRIHTSSGAVQAFLTRIVMQTIYDVLQQQGRVVLLPDAIISAILDQLSVRISYKPT